MGQKSWSWNEEVCRLGGGTSVLGVSEDRRIDLERYKHARLPWHGNLLVGFVGGVAVAFR